MSSNSINSRMAARRNHSLTRRWTSGSGTRRRSGRGGKNGTRPAVHFSLLPLPPFQPDQKTVAQHHRDRVSMKAIPPPSLVLIPAQFCFRFFMILLHPVATVRILDQHGQGRVGREVTPEIFPVPALAASGALPNQPTDMAGAIPIHPPATQREKLGPQPPFRSFAPCDRLPGLERLRRQHGIGPEHRAALPPTERHTEIGPHGYHVPLPSLLQAVQEIGIIPVIGITGHARVSYSTGIGLIQQRQGKL